MVTFALLVGALPVYGLAAGVWARVVRRHTWGHWPGGEFSGPCPFQRGGPCNDCGWWHFLAAMWPVTVPLVAVVAVFRFVVLRPAMRLYRFALGESDE